MRHIPVFFVGFGGVLVLAVVIASLVHLVLGMRGL